ncbi:hypothetical protein PQO03_13675 [Lentisphaera profundi]|uniref:Uncharacterized protein n=1 Tax=Lentisphaera profundi TaxID=1658616 RepID=A0ABY7VYK9_9BACT|nr:hypothetical protein [Lentisphaera profundi]WDE98884.1 hypothetical protein PQO03_13675 [Lentisphaera profundi]
MIRDYGEDSSFTGYTMPIFAGYPPGVGSSYEAVKLTNISKPSDAMFLGESNYHYYNGGESGFTSSFYHNGLYNRLFIDGHVGQGFQNQGFSIPGGYYYQWSYETGL